MDVAIETLFERAGENAARLPDGLRAAYGGVLNLPPPPPERPYVVANFVSTLDGVVSFKIPGQAGGATVSGKDAADVFIMGLLRASADAVLVGAGTVAATAPRHLWVAQYIYSPAADLYGQYRQTSGKPKNPLTVIVTGTGRIDLSRAVFHTPDLPVVVLTTERGRQVLTDAGAGTLPSTTIRALAAPDGGLAPAAMLAVLKHEFGASLVVHEGGPTLLGQFVADGLLDELFLTLAPQIAGRSPAHPRLALIEGTAFVPQNAPWLDLLSAKRAGDHLYLRYRRP